MHDRSRDATGAATINGFAGEYSPFRYRSAEVTEDHADDHAVDHADASDEDARSEPGGFAGTCKTTLIDWIQLVQMGRRDAVLGVHTHDGKHGTLWCRDGDIIDADCDGMVGEAAVFRALSWKSGRVSVDFDAAVTRHRQIETATSGLLLQAAYRRDSGIHELADLAASSESADTPGPFDFTNDRTEVSAPAHLFAFDEHAHQSSIIISGGGTNRNALSLRFVLAGGLTVALLFSAVAWRWMYPAAAEDPILETPIPARVISANAATTRRAPRPLSEGQGKGEARRVAGAVRPSTPTAAAPPSISKPATAQPPTASKSAPARHHATLVVARRSAVTSTIVPSSHPLEAPRAPLPAKARIKVDLINEPAEPAQPRVQIIRDADKPAQPRVQIIQDRTPRIDTVE